MKNRKRFRYLNVRLECLFITICVLIFFLEWGLVQKWLVSGVYLEAVILLFLLTFISSVYFWIWKPYRKFVRQVQRFADGYIALSDLNDVDVAVSAEMEQMISQMSKIIATTRTLDMSKRQAQYRALQNQINPHFLYNTLEGIRSEAIIAGLDNLADMTEALAIFFRYTISKVENLVTIEEELENCDTYFKIQQYRFGKRIHLVIEREEEDWEDILHCMIPKLTLQPILENSIIHGIELKLEEGTVRISISKTQTRLLIRVSDDGVGMNRSTLDRLNAKLCSKEEELKNVTQPEKGGVALVNVNNRIHLLFGEEYGMHVYSLENMGTSVELSIPVISNENELNKVKKKEL